MEKLNQYIEENKERFLNELFELIRIPSISSEVEHKPDMYRCAEKWKSLLLAAGADKAEVYETEGNPVTYGEKIIDPSLPTVLVYGHMDVMPVDPVELWHTQPFEPVIKDGKIWARGADDDKGQSFMHAKAFEYMVKTGNLKCNVKFMLEGEENRFSELAEILPGSQGDAESRCYSGFRYQYDSSRRSFYYYRFERFGLLGGGNGRPEC